MDNNVEKVRRCLPRGTSRIPPKRDVELAIELEKGTKPISRPVYKLSPAELDELKAQLTILLEKGLIRPSKSPWGAPHRCMHLSCSQKRRMEV